MKLAANINEDMEQAEIAAMSDQELLDAAVKQMGYNKMREVCGGNEIKMAENGSIIGGIKQGKSTKTYKGKNGEGWKTISGGQLEGGFGACIPDSLEIWSKFNKLGAKRVRGKRHIEKAKELYTGVTADTPVKYQAFHYWVELKGKVYDFDPMLGQLYIWDKAEYYEILNITEPSTVCNNRYGLFDTEMEWIMICESLPNVPAVMYWLSNVCEMEGFYDKLVGWLIKSLE
jgi:hypothetical protein